MTPEALVRQKMDTLLGGPWNVPQCRRPAWVSFPQILAFCATHCWISVQQAAVQARLMELAMPGWLITWALRTVRIDFLTRPRFDQDPEMGFSALLELARSSIVKLGRKAGLLRRRRKRPAAATVEDSG